MDSNSDIINEHSATDPLPALFLTSTTICHEMIHSVMSGRTCNIWINAYFIHSDFLLHTPMEPISTGIRYARHLRKERLQLPLCQKLRLNITLPSPRNAEDFLQIRRNVATAVSWFNALENRTLPRMEVKLRLGPQDSDGSGVRCVYNDFAMLMGPLSKLIKPCTRAIVLRNTGWKSHNAEVERQSSLLENFLNGSADALKELTYQQSMLEVKLALCIGTFRFYRRDRYVNLTAAKAAEISKAVATLRTWCEEYNESPPPWLDDLQNVCGRKVTLEHDAFGLVRRVLEGRKLWQFEQWAAGLTTSFSPF